MGKSLQAFAVSGTTWVVVNESAERAWRVEQHSPDPAAEALLLAVVSTGEPIQGSDLRLLLALVALGRSGETTDVADKVLRARVASRGKAEGGTVVANATQRAPDWLARLINRRPRSTDWTLGPLPEIRTLEAAGQASSRTTTERRLAPSDARDLLDAWFAQQSEIPAASAAPLAKRLVQHPLCHGDAVVAWEFARRGCLQAAPAATQIYKQGDENRHLYAVLQGECRVMRDGVVTGRRAAGSWFGFVEFLRSDSRAIASVDVTQDTVLLVIGSEMFREVANHQPRVWEDLVLTQAARLAADYRQRTDDRVERLFVPGETLDEPAPPSGPLDGLLSELRHDGRRLQIVSVFGSGAMPMVGSQAFRRAWTPGLLTDAVRVPSIMRAFEAHARRARVRFEEWSTFDLDWTEDPRFAEWSVLACGMGDVSGATERLFLEVAESPELQWLPGVTAPTQPRIRDQDPNDSLLGVLVWFRRRNGALAIIAAGHAATGTTASLAALLDLLQGSGRVTADLSRDGGMVVRATPRRYQQQVRPPLGFTFPRETRDALRALVTGAEDPRLAHMAGRLDELVDVLDRHCVGDLDPVAPYEVVVPPIQAATRR